MFNPQQLLESLTQFPHRGVGSEFERKSAEILIETLQKLNFIVYKQGFKTHRTYVSIIGSSLIAIIVILFFSVFAKPSWAFVIVLISVVYSTLRYLDWRTNSRIIPSLFGGVKSENIVGYSTISKPKKVVLMAHYDSAPVSALYKKQSPNSFRYTVVLSMILMALAVVDAVLMNIYPDKDYLKYVALALIVYFIGQGIMATIGYFTNGFTNGASDNATGVAAAIATAVRLQNKIENTELEIVLTSAEEVGMVGAFYYWKYKFDKSKPTYLINFDTLGGGDLKLITQTGSLTTIKYDNIVTHTAIELTKQNAGFQNITTGKWHTADFDSAWFVRDGVPCVTLAALDEQGLMPRIHRPEDTLANVDTKPMYQAIDFAEAIVIALDKI